MNVLTLNNGNIQFRKHRFVLQQKKTESKALKNSSRNKKKDFPDCFSHFVFPLFIPFIRFITLLWSASCKMLSTDYVQQVPVSSQMASFCFLFLFVSALALTHTSNSKFPDIVSECNGTFFSPFRCILFFVVVTRSCLLLEVFFFHFMEKFIFGLFQDETLNLDISSEIFPKSRNDTQKCREYETNSS